MPVTYMNSTAAIKAFCGRNSGVVCTSSNAEVALRWAYDQVGGVDGDGKVLFLPDQHLGRNTAVERLGYSLDDCVLYDPRKPLGGNTREQARGRTHHPVEGPLLRARAVPQGECGQRTREGAGHQRHRASRVLQRGGPRRRLRGLHGVHHQGP
ncbi:hypothetical protein GCM10025876_01980 [Demequina litorisediminis]|uniref:quinolinate synthase n=1 Tax=Demequina litorisediminis TaxID=1849022 RepID=A0ABQ6I8P9_9MICO|nr:hypothetical protein GCM10025876_01980 [Demequina litorisediminis]